jgi:hypothetical protein
MSISGSGTESTQTFTAPGEWQMNYTYDCTSFGQKGNFDVNIDNGNGTDSDLDGPNELGLSGSATEYYHEGGTFYLQVISECNWTVQIKG